MGKKYKLIYVLLLTLLLDCFGCRKKSISDSNNPTATQCLVMRQKNIPIYWLKAGFGITALNIIMVSQQEIV